MRTKKQVSNKFLHLIRLVSFGLMAIVLIGIHYVGALQHNARQVLEYAVNVNHADLAALTNQKRGDHGLPPLSLNSQLNSGAQAKANHMIAHNYWAHTAPDGTQPWYFFDQSGYPYVHAGENLAYGFSNSGEIIDAWLNSPGHKANLLGDYKEMGFGFTNGSNYQGGEYTVVVAFYGSKTEPKPAPPPPPPAPAPVVQNPPSPPPASVPEPIVIEPSPEPQPSAEEPTQQQQPEPIQTATEPKPDNTVEAPKRVTNLQNLLSGNGSWVLYTSLGIIGTGTAGFGATHWRLIKRGWRKGAHFILVHPLIDLAILAAVTAVVLASTAGFIR